MRKITLLAICTIIAITLNAQSFQLFTEDFELTNGFTMNNGGPSTSIGNNRWVITSNFSGAPTYVNTMSEDSTYNGNISFAPHSKYLHIYDSFSGITNANYDATNPSDNFTELTNGICTLGMDSVQLMFFYLCEGSSTAYGEVYYSINGGPWVQTGQPQYNNKYKWQYENITDPVFSNQTNVRFGFRWVNGNGTPPSNESFSIDDVDIVASAGTVGGPITCSVDSVVPNPVCQGNYIYIYWHLSDTLCDGSYTIQLSNSSGTFPGTNAWVFNVYYPQTSGVISIQLPNSVAAGNCYKIRINRTSPFPTITGVASACFSIIVCSNNIATLQPIVTTDTNSVCIGSAIDVPFWSTGAYSSNTYIAQLSDSNGVFPVMPTVINSMLNSNTYSSSLPPFQPGSVSGIMPNVTPGCNYFIRVVSTNPVAIGTPWGPFCIGQCDIETNNNTDIDFCVTDCFVNPLGQNTTISVGINTFDSTGTGAVYNSGNIFKTQLLSSLNFAQIGSNGILGEVAATHDTIMSIHVPCADSLSYYGISSGEYYMRTIATNTTQPDNALGGLIRVTIGATHAVGPTITCYDYSTFIPADTACMGVSIFPMFSPYNYSNNSTYLWSISGFNGGLPFQSPMGGNSDNCGYAFNFIPGSYTFSVQETNNGCVGPWSPLTTVIVLAPPAVPIAGPSTICAGDTAHYYIPAQTGLTSGVWSSNNGNGILLNSTYTDIDVIGQTTGNFLLTIQATNFCGLSSNSRNLLVKPYPLLGTNGDTSICANQSLTLSTPLGTGYIYNWMDGTNTLSTYDSVTVNPTNTTSYFLSVTGPGQCISRDTVLVTVNLVDTSVVQNGLLLTANASNAFYQWLYCNTGNSPISGAISQNYSATSDGTYSVIVTQNGCMDTSSCYSVTTVGLTENTLDNSITISPNPFTSQTIISFHGEQRNTTIKITDVLGKEIKTLTFSGKQCTLEKGEMKAGIYFVNITDEKKNVVNRKIIIQ